MFLEQRFSYFTPPPFNIAAAGILGTTQQWPIDRTWPIEEIVVHVGFTVTTALVMAPASAQSLDAYDNVLQLLSHVNMSINDGKNPRSNVDISGVGLLEYISQFNNLDAATLQLVGASQTVGLPTGCYELTYRIPMADPDIGEPLRSRMFLPVHRYPQDPVLKLSFNTVTGMGCSAGVIGNVYVDVQLIRRVPTPESEALLIQTAPRDQLDSNGKPLSTTTGYIPFDLIETPYGIGTGVGTEQRFALPVPGQYLALAFRHYLGGANITRNVLDTSGIGDTVAHGFGAESRWRLETGGITVREWKWKHLRALNDWGKPQFNNPVNLFAAATSAGSPTTGFNLAPNFSGALLASTNFRPASSTLLNFLNDGMGSDTGTELGSLLDCNTPANNGLKMEIIGTPASVATNGSTLAVIGRRLFGDLSRWQKFQ